MKEPQRGLGPPIIGFLLVAAALVFLLFI